MMDVWRPDLAWFNETYLGLACRNDDGFRISRIILLTFDERANVLRCDQPESWPIFASSRRNNGHCREKVCDLARYKMPLITRTSRGNLRIRGGLGSFFVARISEDRVAFRSEEQSKSQSRVLSSVSPEF